MFCAGFDSMVPISFAKVLQTQGFAVLHELQLRAQPRNPLSLKPRGTQYEYPSQFSTYHHLAEDDGRVKQLDETRPETALRRPAVPRYTMTVVPENSQPIQMLDFARQFAGIRQEILDAIENVCVSQKFILGPQVTSFEQAAAKSCAVPHAIGCASGTDAIWLAMAAANIGPGDAVITTPFSFFATVSAILRCGAQPLLADIDPATFNLSSTEAEEVLRSSTGTKVKAILPVHLYGQCADWDAFTALKQNYDLLLVEDAAQAFGATWNGIPAGALGDAAAFSFYPTKNLSAMGDAGLVTTLSAAIDDHARVLRAHGMRRRYYHDEIGWNSRLDSLQAAILEVKLRY